MFAFPQRRALRPAVRAAVLVLMCMSGVQAQTLGELYQAAKGFDAAYLAARAQAEEAQHKADAQWGLLRLPNVGLNGTIARSHLNSSAPGAAGDAASGYTTNKRLGITARQTIYNRANDADIEKADQAVIAAQADLKSAEDDLIVRLTQAYFDVLAAQDGLTTSRANKKALEEQLAAAKRNFEVGNATITDTREAQARYDLATAQELASENELKVKSLALDQLVGITGVAPRPLSTPVSLPPVSPGTANEWLSQIEESPSVRKAAVGVAVAQEDTRKARAGHLPTVDAIASIARNDIDNNNAAIQATSGAGTSKSIGLELNLPIFAGFSVQNQIKASLSAEERAQQDLNNARRSVTLATRQAFFGLQSGMAQVKALEAAEASAKLALEATQLGYRVGVRINKDVLDAQNLVASTQRDLFRARYDVLVASMKLRQASGTLKAEDLDSFNRLLAPATQPAP